MLNGIYNEPWQEEPEKNPGLVAYTAGSGPPALGRLENPEGCHVALPALGFFVSISQRLLFSVCE